MFHKSAQSAPSVASTESVKPTWSSRLLGTATASVLVGAAALAVAALPATSAEAVTTCAGNCITNLETQRGGLSLGATFDTSVPTTDALTVYRDGNLITQTSTRTQATHHKLTTPEGLAANTAYSWHLVVTDGSGNVAERTGNLTTLHRRVTVQFSTATVTNDSDSGSAGDFRTFVGIPGSWQVPPLAPESIESGSTVNLAGVLQQTDATTSTLVRTEMYDNDYVWLPFTDELPAKPVWTSGSNVAGDWATASGTLDTWHATNGLKPFQIQVNANVGFVVRGSYSVDFVA